MNKEREALIVIIHFHPLERFPPVINLLNYLATKTEQKIIVVSTKSAHNALLSRFQSDYNNIHVKRTPAIFPSSGLRIFRYIFFYGYSLYLLIKYKPKSILYFETISSWPALFYKRLRKNKVKLLAHYHEYNTPLEYENGMRLVRTMHQIESKRYPHAFDWVSQTNDVRLKKFIKDNHLQNVDPSIFHTMPNYPSKFWAKESAHFKSSGKIKLVYVGSLGYDTMYLKQLTDWVLLNKKDLSLDFYSDNIDDKAKSFLNSINDETISFHGGCNYKELPGELSNFDVGLVIYKPVSDNWIYNAPNKVFEYLACGLDVWFSKTITYTLSLARENIYPKIIPVDFDNLKEFDIQKAINREGINCHTNHFFYENVYGEIYKSFSEA